MGETDNSVTPDVLIIGVLMTDTSACSLFGIGIGMMPDVEIIVLTHGVIVVESAKSVSCGVDLAL